jgi:hypothetical protein
MDDKIVEAFEFGKLQECKNIKLKLDEHNVSWEEFFEWLDEAATRIKMTPRRVIPDIPRKVLKRKCPKCKSWLTLNTVNNHPGLMVGGDWKCQWFCMHCEWEQLSKEEIIKEAQPYIEEV